MATTTRVDPLKNFRFKVRFSDSTNPILGVSKVTRDEAHHRDDQAPLRR